MNHVFDVNDAIFDYVYGLAMSDATRRTPCAGSYIDFLDEAANKAAGIAKKWVQDYINEIVSESKSLDFYDVAIEVEVQLNSINKLFSFGNAQKLINMVAKYVYIRNYDAPCDAESFSECHAPLDGIMRDFVYRSWFYFKLNSSSRKGPGFCISGPWSKLKGEKGINEYRAFQIAITQIIEASGLKKNGESINRLEFDFIFWEKAKKLKDKDRNGQIEAAKEIWDSILSEK